MAPGLGTDIRQTTQHSEVLAALEQAAQTARRSTREASPQEHTAIVDARALLRACDGPLIRIAQTVQIALDGSLGRVAAMPADQMDIELVRPYLSLLRDCLQELEETAAPYIP